MFIINHKLPVKMHNIILATELALVGHNNRTTFKFKYSYNYMVLK